MNIDSVHTGSFVGICLQLSAVSVAVLLTGCAELRWQKPGADAAALDADLQQCTQKARLDARHQEVPRLESALVLRADPQGRPVVVPSSTRDTDRYLVERDFTAACMSGKGYELLPAGKAVTSDN